MKIIAVTLLFLLVSILSKAQNGSTKIKDIDTASKIYTYIEKEAEYPGGVQEFVKYVASNVHYPPVSKKNKIQGKVILTFVIGLDGYVTDVKIIKGVAEDIDQEAIRVIKNSPKWDPGIQNGKPVRIQQTILINFAL